MKANDDGDYFPVWGTCLGFELLNVIFSDYEDVLSHIDDESHKNHFLNVLDKGRLFAPMSDE